MTLDGTLRQLTATAEASRLRLLAALLSGESTVGDLVAMLEQSQPRVSRHLRVLSEAGLLESFREGRSIYYRWSDAALGQGVAALVTALRAGSDATLAGDRARLGALRLRREQESLRRTLRAGKARGLRAVAATDQIAGLLAAVLGTARVRAALEIGAGAGDLLRWLLPRAGRVVGTEAAGHRRQLARCRLQAAGEAHWTVRDAAPEALPFATGSFDLVLLTDSLGPSGSRAARLSAAARVLAGDGRLLVFDHVLPRDQVPGDPLASQAQGGVREAARLSDAALTADLAALGLQVTRRQWLTGPAPDRALFLATRAAAVPHGQPAQRTGTHD